MRLPKNAHTSRPWRVHEFTADFELEDVWELPTPGGPDDLARLVDMTAAGRFADGREYPAAFRALFALRWKLGEFFGWDKADSGVGQRVRSLRERLQADLLEAPRGPDRREAPGRREVDGPPIFTSVYLTHDEWVSEVANRTVHSLMHIGWVPDDSGGGYHAQMAVLTKPNGWLGRAYMAAIKPFRYLVIYPALMRAIERAWQTNPSSSSPPGSPRAVPAQMEDKMRLADQRAASARMKGQAPDRVRRVGVTDPIAAVRRYHYADAFELRLEGPDRCLPEEWVRAGVDATPAWIKRIAGARDGLGSDRIIESDGDVVVLEDTDPLMDTVLVGRNLDPDRRVLTTILRYRRPLLARAVWAFVGILHRRTARQVVAGGLRHERAHGMDPLRKRKLSRLLEKTC
jgi:hypothetical protein